MTILLIVAPVAWLFSQSTNAMLDGHVASVVWLVSTIFGLRFLNAAFSHNTLVQHRLNAWIIVFVLVVLPK
jgi:hypothetical protein